MGSSNTPPEPGNERMYFVRREEIPVLGQLVAERSLSELSQVSNFRHELKTLLEQRGVEPDITQDLLVAAGEASNNACVHGGGGRCCVFASDDRLVVRVSDNGPGISAEYLARAVFETGFSSIGTCGMGYTLMLGFADRIWLATDPTGTVVQLEKCLVGTASH